MVRLDNEYVITSNATSFVLGIPVKLNGEPNSDGKIKLRFKDAQYFTTLRGALMAYARIKQRGMLATESEMTMEALLLELELLNNHLGDVVDSSSELFKELAKEEY